MGLNNLVRKELHQMRWIIIIGILFGLALAAVIVGTFHYLGDIVEEIPPEILELLARYELSSELLFIFNDYTVYVWSQWQAKNLLQVGALLAIVIAATQFAGEVSRKTIGFYLTRPVSRRSGYLAKTLAGMLVLLVFFIGGTLFIWLGSVIMGHGADWGKLSTALVVGLIWMLAYYHFGCIISTLNREPVTAGVIIGAAGVLLSVPGLFAAARQFSIFYQMRAADYFMSGQPVWPSLGWGLLLNILFLIVGIKVFSGRDF